MLTPYEVAVKSVIPAIRSAISKRMVTNYSFTQKEVACMLGLSQSAISRYDSLERGGAIDLSSHPDVVNMIDDLSTRIATGRIQKEEVIRRIDEICDYIIRKGYMCNLHRRVDPQANPDCTVCLQT